MAWLPDHIWLAQKAARAAKGGGKGVKKTFTKNVQKTFTKNVQMQALSKMAKKGKIQAGGPKPVIKAMLKQRMQSGGGAAAAGGKPAKIKGTQIQQVKGGGFVRIVTSDGKEFPIEANKAVYKYLRSIGEEVVMPNPNQNQGGKKAKPNPNQNQGGKKVMKGMKKKERTPEEQAARQKMMEKLKEIDIEQKVWVGGLPKDCTWKMVAEHFTKVASKPKLTHIMSAKKGTACCVFADAGDASSAIAAANGTLLKGQPLEVDVWTKLEKETK